LASLLAISFDVKLRYNVSSLGRTEPQVHLILRKNPCPPMCIFGTSPGRYLDNASTHQQFASQRASRESKKSTDCTCCTAALLHFCLTYSICTFCLMAPQQPVLLCNSSVFSHKRLGWIVLTSFAFYTSPPDLDEPFHYLTGTTGTLWPAFRQMPSAETSVGFSFAADMGQISLGLLELLRGTAR
jgi:hypothetical protein